jgi:hypothetical protein
VEILRLARAQSGLLLINPVAVEKVPKLSFLLLTAPCMFLILRLSLTPMRVKKEFFNTHSSSHQQSSTAAAG